MPGNLKALPISVSGARPSVEARLAAAPRAVGLRLSVAAQTRVPTVEKAAVAEVW